MHCTKKGIIHASWLILVVVLGLMTACDGLFPPGAVSAQERLESFEKELNTPDRDTLYKHFHSTETENYNQIKDPDTLQVLLPENRPFTLTLSSALSDTQDGRKQGSGTIKNGIGTTFTMQVLLYPVDDIWYIEELLLQNGSTTVVDVRVMM